MLFRSKSFNTEFVSQPDSLETSSEFLTNIACKGETNGSIALDFRGGTLPYSYAWSVNSEIESSIDELAAGTYEATITDGMGCTALYVATITEPDSINIDTLNIIPSLCDHDSSGSSYIIVNGGTNPYTYQWTNGATTQNATGMAVGAHTVTVTDFRGCINFYTLTITDSLKVFFTGLSDTAVCENVDVVELNVRDSVAPAGTTLDLLWIVDATDTLSIVDSALVNPVIGDNFVTLTASYMGCSWDTVINVTVNVLPDVEAGDDLDMLLNGTRELGGNPTSLAGSLFSWSPPLYLSDTTLANPEITPEEDGIYSYTVQVTDTNGCVSLDSIIVNVVPVVEVVDLFTPNNDGIKIGRAHV